MKLVYKDSRFGIDSDIEYDLSQFVLVNNDGTRLNIQQFIEALTLILKEISIWKEKSGAI